MRSRLAPIALVIALCFPASLLLGQEICSDGIDNDLDGDIDCLDLECAPAGGYALGLEGPAVASDLFDVSVVLDNAAGAVSAWNYALCHDPAVLAILDATSSPELDALLAGPGAEFVQTGFDATSHYALVIVDITNIAVLPAGSRIRLTDATYQLLAPGTTPETSFSFCAGGPLAAPPTFYGPGNVILPLTHCGLSLGAATAFPDECADALPIASVVGVSSVAFDTTAATDGLVPVSGALCPGTGLGEFRRDVWYRFTPTADGYLSLSTCGLTAWDTDIAVFTGSCGALVSIACNGDGPGCPDFTSLVPEIPVTMGTEYRIRIGGWDSAQFGPGTLEVSYFPFAAPADLTCASESAASTAIRLTWTEPDDYDQVEVRIDGALAATLAGSGAGAGAVYVTAPLSVGPHDLEIVGFQGGLSRASSCSAFVSVPCPAASQVLSPVAPVLGGGFIQCLNSRNRVFRALELCAPPFSVAERLEVTCFTVGIDRATSGSGTTEPLIVRLHSDASGGPVGPLADLTLLYAEQFEIPDLGATLYNLPVGSGTPLAGSSQLPCLAIGETLVVEIDFTNGAPLGHTLFLATPPVGTPETSPTYIVAPSCGFGEPVAYASIGFPDTKLICDIGVAPLEPCSCGDGIFGFSCAQVPGTTRVELSWVNSGDVGSVDVLADGILIATLDAGESSYTTDPFPERSTVTFTVSASDSLGAPLNEGGCTRLIAPSNNWASGALAVPVCTSSVPFDIDSSVNTTGAALDPGTCSIGDDEQLWNDLWYCYTAAATTTTIVRTCGASVDTRLAVYDNWCAGADPLTVVACNDVTTGAGCGDEDSSVSFLATAGSTYLIRLGAFNAAGFGAGELQIVEVNAQPIVTGAPAGPIVLDSGAGDLLDLTLQVSAPEPCQAVSLFISDPGHALTWGLSILSGPPGSDRTFEIDWAPTCITPVGFYPVTLTFWDDSPSVPYSAVVTLSLQVVDASCAPADLVVLSPSAPREIAFGGSASLGWITRNDGVKSAAGPWVEAIYASLNDTLDASDELLATTSFAGMLPGGSQAVRGLVVPAPSSLSAGPITLLVCTDTDPEPTGVIVEGSDSNNCTGVPIILGTNDLAVEGLAATPTIIGIASDISWITVNQGSVTAFGGFAESVHFSVDAALDAGDILVATVPFAGDFGPGESQPRSVQGAVPGSPSPGTYHWIVTTNSTGSVPDGNPANDVQSIPFTLGTVDLELISITPPANPIPGEPTTLIWSVRNNGTITPPAPWQERLTLSSDGDGDPSDDIPLAVVSFSPAVDTLLPGEIATRSIVIPFPAAPMGPQSILACADSGNALGETDESNGCALEAVCVDCLHPDLRVVAAPAVATANDGATITVDWSVVNEGTADAPGSWVDRVYLSADATLAPATDLLLAAVTVTGPLSSVAPGNGYARSASVTIPAGLHGSYYFIVQTDATAAVVEPGEEGDNVLAAIAATDIEQPNEPDLSLQILTTAGTVYVDTALPLSWLVTNLTALGTANGAWVDRVYLSSDSTLDPGVDPVIAEAAFSGVIGPGTSYFRASSPVITAPPGSYTLFYAVDALDAVPETDESNVLSQPIAVAAAPDLELFPFSVPATVALTESITVNWTVQNSGSAAAISPWVDRVYLSTDASFDLTDTLVGTRSRTVDLAPGLSYGESLAFPAPTPVGLYWVFVDTDEADQVAEALDAAPNRRVAGPIDVYSLTPPDLRVVSVAPIGPACGSPTGVRSGDLVTVEYTVTNEGIDPAVGVWTDAIRISTDAAITNADPVLGSGVFQGTLLPGASYSRSVTVTLPEDQPGCYRLAVQTDSDGPGAIGAEHDIDESDESDNVLAGAEFAVELAPQPDLAVLTALYVPTAFAGQTFTLQYSVANVGSAPTDGGIWFESVHLVDLGTLVDIALLGTYVRAGPILPAGASDGLRTVSGTIPIPFSGCYGLRVRLDTDERISEEGVEGNNAILASALSTPVPGVVCGDGELEVTPVVPLDLSPAPGSPATSTATLARGGTTVVTWEAWNGGGRIENELGAPVTFAQTWKDEIWFSADPDLDAGDVLLKTVALATATNGLGEPTLVGIYPRAATVALPADLPVGNGYLLIRLNSDAGLVETDFADNVGALAIPVVIDPPDLAAHLPSAGNPADVAVGEQVAIAWEVTNVLAAPTGATSWRDQIFLDQGSSQTLLATVLHEGALGPGGSYAGSTTVTIPVATPGGASLRVVADALLQVFEEGLEANNTASLPIVIRSDAADLTIPSAPTLGASSVNAGQPLAISWSVQNVSSFPPNASTWIDRVYLSVDTSLSADDVAIGARTHSGGLAGGGSYVRSGNFTIPPTVQGNRFVIVRTDGPNAVFESDETNNDAVASPVLSIAPVLPPNLIVAGVAVTSAVPVFSGQNLDLSWSLTNIGSGDILEESWIDGIYLSTNTTLETGSDLFLGSFVHSFVNSPDAPPLAGETIVLSDTFDVPPGIEGDFFILVKTDLYNSVPELGGEIDNVGSTAAPVPLVIPDPANLVVEGLTIPAAGTIGTPAAISWQARNLDHPTDPIAAVQGRWFDTVVLSLDAIVGEEDTILGTFDSGTQGQLLSAGSAIPRAIAPVLPPIPPGEYHVIVVTDALAQIPETDEENRFPSLGTIQVLAIDLPVDTVVPLGLSAGDFRLFRLDTSGADPGDTLELSFEHADPQAWTEVLIAFDRVPASNDFDHASGLPTQPSQLLRIPDIQAGEYFVLARTAGSTQSTQNATIDWTILVPQIETATPDRIGNEGRVTVRFDGAGFLPELGNDPMNVSLEDGAGTVLHPRRVERIDSTRFIAEFELAAAPLGGYDVVVQNGSVGTTTALDLIAIETLVPPVLGFEIAQQASFRSGEIGTLQTVATNLGNVDAPFVVVSHRVPRVLDRRWIAGRSDATLTLAQEIAGVIAESAIVRSLPPGGTIALASDIRLEVLPEIGGVVLPGELAVRRGGAVLSLEEFVDRMETGAEVIRLALLADPSLLPEPTFVAIQPELLDAALWRARWFQELVLAGLFDPADLATTGSPPTPNAGIDPCGDTSLEGIGIAACFEAHALAAGDAFVPARPDEALIVLECGIEELWDTTRCDLLEIRAAVDPNEKTNPTGAGVEAFVGFQRKIPYTIYFENTASVEFGSPASRVTIVDTLPQNLLLESVRLQDLEIGGIVYPVPPDRIFFQARLDLLELQGVFVDVTAGVNVLRREVFWTFQSIDPSTGLPPTSGNLGFLPPSDGSGSGSGSVEFEVSPFSATAVPEQIINRAAITFDTAAPILTNSATNRLDPKSPSSSLVALPGFVGSASALLSWSGQDDPAESGLESYTLWGAPTGSDPVPILADTTETSFVLTGTPGVTYDLWVTARDFAGNVEPLDLDAPKATFTFSGVAPTITTGPAGATRCVGESVTFSVEANGSEPLAYQWRRDGSVIAGATEATLTLDPVSVADAGEYSVVVTNGIGSATSAGATLGVIEPVQVVTPPQALSLCVGLPATLAVSATGTGPLAYQWSIDGTPIAGATSDSLDLDPLSVADAGAYSVEISNACNTVTTAPVDVVVLEPLAILSPPGAATLCVGQPLHLEVAFQGSSPVGIQWFRDGAPIPGATSAQYDVGAVSPADQGVYTVELANGCGTLASAPVDVEVRAAPSIIADPVPASSCVGGSVLFSVTALGSPALFYQWFRDGQPLPGETSASLSIAMVDAPAAGAYAVSVTNDCGSALSASASLAVLDPVVILVPPAPASLCEGDPLSLAVDAAGSPPLAFQWRRDGAAIPGATGATYTVPAVGSADAGTYSVSVTNACGSSDSGGAAVVVDIAPSISVPPQGVEVCPGEAVTLTVDASGSAPLSFQWLLDGSPIPGANSDSLAIPATFAGDAGSYTVEISNGCGSVASAPAAVTLGEAPSISADPVGAQVCPDAPFSLTVAFAGSEPISVQWLLEGVPIPGATSATYSVAAAGAADAGAYSAAVTNDCGSVVSSSAIVDVLEAPAVTLPPDISVCVGTPVSIAATVVGTPARVIQWSRNGIEIPGADQPLLDLGAVGELDAGSYTIVVTNGCGSASTSIVLTVELPPAIIEDPQDLLACLGETVTLQVVASGSEPLSYQWLFGGVALPGADGATLALPAVDAADGGEYSVVVANACGSTTSAAATLAVSSSPLDCDCNVNGILDATDIAGGTSLDADLDGVPDECQLAFIRGDADEDGAVTIADAIAVLSYLFLGDPQNCLANLDASDDGMVDIGDPVRLLMWLFVAGGVPPPAPYPECGADPTPNSLPCDTPLGCP